MDANTTQIDRQSPQCLFGCLAGVLMLCAFPVAASEWPSDTPADPKHDLHHGNVWVNNVGTTLYGDSDRDRFFTGMSLSLDADTAYHSTEVYFAIDLTSSDHQTIRLHTTSDFHVYGTSVTDEYRVDIDLLSNYNPSRYDITLSLFDAHTNEILDRVGESEFSNLRQLPLESEDNDNDSTPANDPEPANQPNSDVRVVEYGGSAGLLFGGLLACALLWRRKSG